MAWFWLYDGTNTYSLDDNVVSLNIGNSPRKYTIIEYAGADGGTVSGTGNMSTRTITFSKINKLDSSSSTAWNAARDTLIKWYTRAKTEDLYLRIRNGEDTKTIETKIVPIDGAGAELSNIGITTPSSFQFVSTWGYFQNIATSTDTLTITDSTEHSIEITNAGNMTTPIECNFTPTGDETLYQVYLADSYGVRLEKTSFSAGVEVKFKTEDGSLYFDDVEQKTGQFLTAGSPFKIPTGTFDLYVRCSGAGSFDYVYYERYA